MSVISFVNNIEEKTGKSYTRLEYGYAIKKGLPVFLLY